MPRGALSPCGAGTLLAFGLPVPAMAQVAVYCVLGIAPIGWLLAECVLFALATFGNVGGARLTAFVLLRFLGTALDVGQHTTRKELFSQES